MMTAVPATPTIVFAEPRREPVSRPILAERKAVHAIRRSVDKRSGSREALSRAARPATEPMRTRVGWILG